MMDAEQKFLTHLKAEYGARCVRNPRYSLRSFGRSLGVSHSLLSMVFNGRRSPSKGLVAKLKLMDSESSNGCGEDGAFHEISDGTFEAIASWVHYAILGLVTLDCFQPNSKWIAKKLNISSLQARLAWNTLLEHQLVAKEAGRWKQVPPSFTVSHTKPLSAAKAYNRELLSKAQASMDLDKFSERDLTSIIFPMKAEDITYAKQRIKKFRRSLSRELELRPGADRVYALTVQLFPLTKGNL